MQKQLKSFIFFLFIISLIWLPIEAKAQLTEVTVNDAAGLQAALTGAETDTNDTIITLEAGTYSTTTLGATFSYDSALGKSLTLQGAGMGMTILDGDTTHQVLNINHTGNSGTVTLENMTIQNGLSAALNGGGLKISTEDADVILDQMEISNNETTVFQSGGGFDIETVAAPITVNRCLIDSNQSVRLFGGGFLFTDGNVIITVTNNIFSNNTSGDEAGALEIEYPFATAIITNNTFYNNTAATKGGAIYIDVFDLDATAFVYNNIFFNNVANESDADGDDIFGDNVFGDLKQSITIFNNIFSQACFSGGNCDPATAEFVSAGNNLNQNPLFVDAATGDFTLMTLSPAINAGEPNPTGGLPTLDFAGNPRTIGSAPDLGALEALIPFLQITPSSIDFGKVSNGGTANQEITLSNDGFASVQVTAIEINDSDQITVDESAGANPCGSVPFTLAANESCTVVVNWTPITSGTLSASIDWTTDDSFNPILSITISGNVPGSSGCSLTCSDIGKSTTPIIFAFILLSLITFRLSKFYFESIIAKQNLIKYKR